MNEPNDNIANSLDVEVGIDGIEIDANSISTPVDTDWYTLTIPETRNFESLDFKINTGSNNSCKLEVYSDITGDMKMKRLLSGNGKINIQTGNYYVRVIYKNSNLDTFDSSDVENYTLSVVPQLIPDKIYISEFYCGNTNAGYVSYPFGHYYRAIGSIEIRGYVVATDYLYQLGRTEVY